MRALLPNVTHRKGAGIRAALAYDLNPSRAAPGQALFTNLLGRSIDELALEFSQAERQRKVEDPYLRISLSIPPGCHLNQDEWIIVIKEMLVSYGLDSFPFFR